MTQPIKIFSHAQGPNSWRVCIICDELAIPYVLDFVDLATIHTPAYEKYNPNGRVPTIIDPNTNITLWESGAIIKYLVETYDKDNKLSFNTVPEKHLLDQWLFFQASGQGPYFGQALWFSYFHSEQLESAKGRYYEEIKRVTKVLDSALQEKEYLVGSTCTYADLAFVPWYWGVEALEGAKAGLYAEVTSANPNFKAWLDRLSARDSVKKSVAARLEAMAASGH